jgi:hypothetical protein
MLKVKRYSTKVCKLSNQNNADLLLEFLECLMLIRTSDRHQNDIIKRLIYNIKIKRIKDSWNPNILNKIFSI